MQICPRNDYVLVRLEPVEKESPGGIVLPDQANEMPRFGRVEAVGPGILRENLERAPMCIEVGQRVFVQWEYRDKVTARDKPLVLVREEMILAVLGD